MCVRLFHDLPASCYDSTQRYFVSRMFLIILYSFLSRKFKVKRSSEDSSDSGLAVWRRDLFVALLEAWDHRRVMCSCFLCRYLGRI